LVTGGAGFLGSALVGRLDGMGSEVVILDDLSTGDRAFARRHEDRFIHEKVTSDGLSKVGDVDFVFHLGAPSSVILFDRNREAMKDTIDGMRAILDYCADTHVQKLIYATSSSVYGNSRLPQSEEIVANPVNEYGVAKLCTEHLARVHKDVSSIGLRIFAGYGPGELRKTGFCSVVGLFLENIIANESPLVFGDGSQTRDFVYVDDIVESMLRGAETGFEGVINVGSGDALSFLKVIDMISTRLNKKVIPRFTPEPKSYFEHTLADTTRLTSVLRVEPMGLEDGIAKYLDDPQRSVLKYA
jgi:nucleoside-diphosphate-sugar epimerase